jgi:hypothetical protein
MTKTVLIYQTLKFLKLVITSKQSLISTKLIILFTAKLFTTPIRHKIQKRIKHGSKHSKIIKIPAINKEVVVYKYGASEKSFISTWMVRGVVLSCSKLQMNS